MTRTSARNALTAAGVLAAAAVHAASGDGSAAKSAAPRFQCFGTEPFWSVRTVGGTLERSSPDDETERLLITATTPFSGMTWAGGVAFRTTGGTLFAVPQSCSDGMSDREYAWAAIVDTGRGQPLFGCCRPVTTVSVKGVAKDDTLNLRERPDGSSRVLAKIPHDASDVDCFDCARCTEWCEVERKGVRGFVSRRFLDVP